MDKSLGFVAVQARGGAVTIPAEARRALRLDAPGAQVEVILRDHDLLLIPHVAVPLEQMQAEAPARAADGPQRSRHRRAVKLGQGPGPRSAARCRVERSGQESGVLSQPGTDTGDPGVPSAWASRSRPGIVSERRVAELAQRGSAGGLTDRQRLPADEPCIL